MRSCLCIPWYSWRTIVLAPVLACCAILAAPWRVGPSPLYAAGNVHYVNVHATGDNTGQSWQHAYTSLQTALSAAIPGDEIWVAAGVYYPVAVANPAAVSHPERSAGFTLRQDVAVYGGFNGTEIDRAARDWHTNLTVLSGDIDQNDPTDHDGLPAHADVLTGNNSLHVVVAYSVDATAILDGFVVTGGMANGSGNTEKGGGIYISSASPTLANLTIVANRATLGGGLYIEVGSPILHQVRIEGNRATDGGGAMVLGATSAPTFVNSLFSGNIANRGGALFLSSSTAHMTHATISSNRANSQAGAIYSVFQGGPHLQNSLVWGNTAPTAPTFNVPDDAMPQLRNSLVQGCNPAGVWNAECGLPHAGNLADADPLFLGPIAADSAPHRGGDYALPLASPAIDAGDALANPGLDGASTVAQLSGDLVGAPRITALAPDLGALETPAYLLAANTVGSGTILLAPAQIRYAPGTIVTATAQSAPGWTFSGWAGDLLGTTPSQPLTLEQNRTITATFTLPPPIADAGADQNHPVSTEITLDGSGSSSLDPTETLTYGWVQSAGPAVQLHQANAATPTFTAPATPASLAFTLVVTGSNGLASAPDIVAIEIRDIPISGLALAGDSPITLGRRTHFSATVATGSNVEFTWRASDAATPVTLAHAHYSYTYSAAGVYHAQVVAFNAAGIHTATVSVTVSNLPPLAHAGIAQTVTVGSLVTLDGSHSTDPDGHLPLAFVWTQLSGPPVTLSSLTAGQPSFTAPGIPATLQFQLVATDSFGAVSTFDSTTITVIALDSGNPDGGNPDGGDPDGGDPDDGDPDGGDPDGGDPDGGDPDGGDPDGGDPDGGDTDGGDPDGGDPDGGDPDGGNPDDGDPDGGDPDGGDPDGGDPDGGDPDGGDPDGGDPDDGDPDGGDPDSGDPDGGNNRLFVPGLERG